MSDHHSSDLSTTKNDKRSPVENVSSSPRSIKDKGADYDNSDPNSEQDDSMPQILKCVFRSSRDNVEPKKHKGGNADFCKIAKAIQDETSSVNRPKAELHRDKPLAKWTRGRIDISRIICTSCSLGKAVLDFRCQVAHHHPKGFVYPDHLEKVYLSKESFVYGLKSSSKSRTKILSKLPDVQRLLQSLNVFKAEARVGEALSASCAQVIVEEEHSFKIMASTTTTIKIPLPKIDAKDQCELKGQFLKELRDNTFNGSNHEDANEHIEKVLEIVDLFHIPNITQDQIMLRAFPMSLTEAASRWLRNKPSGSITTWEDLKAKFLSNTETSDGLAAIQAQLNNLGREIKKVNEKVYAAQVGCELSKRHEENSKPYQEIRAFTDCLLIETKDPQMQGKMGSYGPKDFNAYSIGTTLHNDALPQKEKDPGSFTLPCYLNNVYFEKALDDLGASMRMVETS
ncbi:copia protein [Tanacetum coccineum]|uniref:Copia protein n=1 Tax=Tanacetum coccineum TaxID=301880 RepID=A0ABQ5DYE6_9ASTR